MMGLSKAGVKALRDILEGNTPHDELSPLTRRLVEIFLFVEENRDELDALVAAEAGDFSLLADIVEKGDRLELTDVRAFIAARLRGDRQTRQKSFEQKLRRIQTFLLVNNFVHERGLSQNKAYEKLMDDGHAISQSVDTVKCDYYRGRDELREVSEALGLPIGKALQKG